MVRTEAINLLISKRKKERNFLTHTKGTSDTNGTLHEFR